MDPAFKNGAPRNNKDQRNHSPHDGVRKQNYNVRTNRNGNHNGGRINHNETFLNPGMGSKLYSGSGASEESKNDDEEVWPDIIPIPINQWIFTMEDWLEKTPSRLSRKKKMVVEDETVFRAKAVMRVREFGKGLNLQLRTVMAASYFIHRFYMFEDINMYDYKLVVATAIFVATKAEENLKPIKAIASVLAKMNKVGPEDINDYLWKISDSIKLLENKFLMVLRFDLVLKFPFDVFPSIDFTGLPISLDKLRKESEWFFRTYIYTPVVILYNHCEIAAISFMLCCARLDLSIPSGFVQKWFGVGVAKICEMINFLRPILMLLTEYKILAKVIIMAQEYTTPELIDYSPEAISEVVLNPTAADYEKGVNEAVINKLIESTEVVTGEPKNSEDISKPPPSPHDQNSRPSAHFKPSGLVYKSVASDAPKYTSTPDSLDY